MPYVAVNTRPANTDTFLVGRMRDRVDRRAVVNRFLDMDPKYTARLSTKKGPSRMRRPSSHRQLCLLGSESENTDARVWLHTELKQGVLLTVVIYGREILVAVAVLFGGRHLDSKHGAIVDDVE